MATHFKWYPAESETVVPWYARYAFPSQTNKCVKMTPRIPPKNSGTFLPGNVIRMELPAQGYVNPSKTTMEFDVTMEYTILDTDRSYLRFQNNIQSIFNRVRLLYCSNTLEDIPSYNVITRALTEWTSVGPQGTVTADSISQGIGGVTPGYSGQLGGGASLNGAGAAKAILVNIRQAYIQGVSLAFTAVDASLASGFGVVPNCSVAVAALATMLAILGKNPSRRYQIQFNLGMFNQEKLIPTKFMASQLAIEVSLEAAAACMIYVTGGTPTTTAPTYNVSNVNLIPEILEFDASYDESFLQGLRQGGVPIKFSTWNNFRFTCQAGTTQNLQIQERSRSTKLIVCLLRRDPATIGTDSGASFYNTCITSIPNNATTFSTFNEYQFRIGGK